MIRHLVVCLIAYCEGGKNEERKHSTLNGSMMINNEVRPVSWAGTHPGDSGHEAEAARVR